MLFDLAVQIKILLIKIAIISEQAFIVVNC
jgi:hypothetical protein